VKQVYIRRVPSRQETVLAAGLAVGLGTALGAAVYYFARAFLARDVAPPLPEAAGRSSAEGGVEEGG
jgi:hypothetical protein